MDPVLKVIGQGRSKIQGQRQGLQLHGQGQGLLRCPQSHLKAKAKD